MAIVDSRVIVPVRGTKALQKPLRSTPEVLAKKTSHVLKAPIQLKNNETRRLNKAVNKPSVEWTKGTIFKQSTGE
jgi:hypothetical protein